MEGLEADSGGTFLVEVVYALPEVQTLVSISVAKGTTVEEAIRLSGLLERYPDIDLGVNKVGIFSRIVALDTPLRPRDRVEIYRPLRADPKEIRKQRARAGR